MTSRLRTDDLPPLTGSPWLTQGAYGAAGNLELVAPAIDDGFWVFWFNADPVDHQQGAAIGCWSGGLHVFAGRHVQAARITQVQAGPLYLEALALAEGELHRLFWTPADGFVHAGVLATAIADASAVTEHGTELRVSARRADGTGLLLTGDARDYPAVTWRESRAAPGDWTRTAIGLHLDGDGALRAGDTLVTASRAHAVTACRTTFDGGRTDVVLAVGDGLVHLYGDHDTWSEPIRIRSHVWAAEDAPVHRR